MSTIWLVRHGQASFGAADYDALSETGVRQSQALAPLLASASRTVSGTLKRHVDTASFAGYPDAARDARWNEYDHVAILSALPPIEAELPLQEVFELAMARWVAGANEADYAEPFRAFRARVDDAFDALVASLGPEDRAVVFTSGGPISLLAGRLLAMPLPDTLRLGWELVNGGVTRVRVGRRGARLVSLNEQGHFAGDQLTLR